LTRVLPAEFTDRINVFVHLLQQRVNEWYADIPYGIPKVKVSARGKTKRRVYLDFSRAHQPNRKPRAYCFVQIDDGAILKATGWDNCVRGNRAGRSIHDEDFGMSTCDNHGINYVGVPIRRIAASQLAKP